MERLRKEIDEVDGGGAVVREEDGEVAGEGDGVAGDVDDVGGGDADEEGGAFRAEACAWGIEDDEVGALALEDGGAEEVKGGGVDGVEGRGLDGEVGQSDGGCFRALNCYDMLKGFGERAREEAYAGEEIPGECAGAVGGDDLDERFDEEAVDLEEGTAADPVFAFSDCVAEAGGAPGGTGPGASGAAAEFRVHLGVGSGQLRAGRP